MLLPATTGSALSVLTTDRSALALTVVVSVSVSLAAFGSVVAELTVAVLLITVPSAVPAGTVTTSENTAGASAGARVAMVAGETPPVMVKVGPEVWVKLTRVVPAGTASARLTFWA